MIGRGPLAALAAFVGSAFTLTCIAFADSAVAGQVFDGLRTTAVVVVSASGVWVAFQGLRTWQRQLRGTALFDASRKFMEGVLQLRNAIAVFRSAWLSGGEVAAAAAKRGKDFDPFKDTEEAVRWLREDRWADVISAILTCQIRAVDLEVVLGARVGEVLIGLRGLVNEIHHAYQREAYRARTLTGSLEEREADADITTDSNLRRERGFSRKLDETFRKAEELVGPHIREHFV